MGAVNKKGGSIRQVWRWLPTRREIRKLVVAGLVAWAAVIATSAILATVAALFTGLWSIVLELTVLLALVGAVSILATCLVYVVAVAWENRTQDRQNEPARLVQEFKTCEELGCTHLEDPDDERNL